ncbi:MAG: carboxypeptidase regulatory-like domain-containing protein [Bacteroidota bacterium]|nr:carboxypeptidase regulatory-like domain-containing protein [Bacteroidota bacterium]
MITTIRRLCAIPISFLFFTNSHSQDLRSFNQNAPGSNHTRAFNQNSSRSNYASGLSISFSPGYSTSLNSNKDSLLFRGSGGGFRFGADYFFGKAGIGLSSGFGSSVADNTAINNFLKNSAVPPDQLLITKSAQQNMYLLLGPSVRFGNIIQLYAQAKGGLFINNAGLVSIQQRGAVRAAYRNESTGKSLYPGFQAGLSLQYSIKSDVWSFGISADYIGTRAEVTNYDARRGNGVEGLNLSQPIRDMVAGITVRYNIFSPRDQASGQSTGRRLLPTVNKREITSSRDAASGQSTGRRLLPTVNKKEIAIDEPGTVNTSQSCGPVTTKITNPDGSTEETTFACPEDAAAYSRQTPKRDFGDRMNNPDQQQNNFKKAFILPHVLEKSGIISGRLTWASSVTGAIVTNKSIMAGTTSVAGTASNTRQTNQSSFGTMLRLSAREAGSGMATGRRAREAGSGMATGRRQYDPVFIEGQGDVCNPCLATAKMSSVKNNPLYRDNGLSGTNPLYDKRTTGGEDEDCDGVAGADIFLIDAQSGDIVAKTKTESCGDFFFANVPGGNYVVRVSAVFSGKKGYDVYMKSKTDLLGDIKLGDDWMQLMINTGSDDNSMTQRAGVSTSRSNIRCRSLTIIGADPDGDGEFESIKVLADLYDGTTRDITAMSRMSQAGLVKKVTVRGWDPQKKQAIAGSANTVKEFTISIDGDNEVMLTSQYENGTKEDTRVMAHISHHPNVVQFLIPMDGTENNEAGTNDKIKTKSNIKNDRVAASDLNGDGTAETIINTSRSNIKSQRVAAGDVDGDGIWSPRSNIKMIHIAAGDVDGDGIADMTAGNMRTEFAVLRDRTKSHFETGDKPTQEQRLVGGALPGGSVISAAVRSGDPIHGVDVKLNQSTDGTAVGTTHTNESGQFVFDNVKEGNYTITLGMNYYIDDETFVTVGEEAADNINTSESNVGGNKTMKGWDGTIKGNATQRKIDPTPARISTNFTVARQTQQASFGERILLEADTDGDGEFETSFLNYNGEIATISITEPGTSGSAISITEPGSHKAAGKATSGIKQTMQTQVMIASNPGPVKWMAPGTTNKRVWGDPHVDEKDGSLKMGEGALGNIAKERWKGSDVAIKTIRCQDGSCIVITAHPDDYPDDAAISLNGLPPGTPVGNAQVWFVDDKGNAYKQTTDASGRINLNGLPPGIPVGMKMNLLVAGNEDVLVCFSIDAAGRTVSNVLKTKHDTVKNSIGNIR